MSYLPAKHHVVLKVMDWRITIGLSFLSLLYNLSYFYFISHNILMALKFAAASILSIGGAHGSHTALNKWKKSEKYITKQK